MPDSNTLKIDRLLQNLLEEILVLGHFQKMLAEFTPDSSEQRAGCRAGHGNRRRGINPE